MKRFGWIFLLFATFNSSAQDSATSKPGDIYRKWPGWKMDGRRLTPKELKQEIYKVPDAIPLYQKSKTNFIISYACLITSSTFALLTRQETDISSANFGKNKWGFAIAGIITSGLSIYLAFHSNKQFKQSIRIRNEKRRLIY